MKLYCGEVNCECGQVFDFKTIMGAVCCVKCNKRYEITNYVAVSPLSDPSILEEVVAEVGE